MVTAILTEAMAMEVMAGTGDMGMDIAIITITITGKILISV